MLFKTKSALLTGVAITLTTLTLTSIAHAKDRGLRGERGDRSGKQFERIDTNDDGVITLDELLVPALAKAETRFERRDTDEDGFLTFEEATAGRSEPLDLTDVVEDVAQCVADLKAETGNEDIADLDPAEYHSPQQKFDDADTSGDGVLDLDEVLAATTEKATNKFANMDADGNQQVTLEEFVAAKTSRKATRRAVKSCIDEILDEEGI